MSAIKGQNNFKESQIKKIEENTKKIEKALNNLPKKIEKITLSKVIKLVSEETGLHFTTINKNEKYTDMCNEKYLSLKLNSIDKNKKSNSQKIDNEIRLLKLENSNLKNQVKTLTNVIKKFEENGNINIEEKIDYKENFDKLLKHFKNQLEIKDGQVIDPYSSIRPVVICDI